MQKACVVLSLLSLMAQTAFGDEYNPFLGNVAKKKPTPKAVSAKSTSAVPASPISLPLPSMPSAPVPYRPMLDSRGSLTGNTEKVAEPKIGFSISGRIGDQIVLTERTGAKSMVQDGSIRNGCFIKFPDIICDKAEIAQARKEFAAEKRVRIEEDEALVAQLAKTKELSTALVKAQEDLRFAAKEGAESMSAASTAKAEVVALKAQIAKEKIQGDELRKQLADVKLTTAKLTSTNSALMKGVTEASADREKLVELQRKLDELVKREAKARNELAEAKLVNLKLSGANAAAVKELNEAGTGLVDVKNKLAEALERSVKAEKELAALKASMDAPPGWVKGIAKAYRDPSLGEVKMSRAAGQVFFRIPREGEDPADKLFGKSVVRKERKGEFTYYALNAQNVRVKE